MLKHIWMMTKMRLLKLLRRKKKKLERRKKRRRKERNKSFSIEIRGKLEKIRIELSWSRSDSRRETC